MSSENSPRESAREGALNLQWYHVNDVCGDIFVACGLFYFSFERKITMDKKILKLLEKNARIEVKDIAAITGKSEAEVASDGGRGLERAVSGEFDLILCGKQTTDGDTAQVGAEVADTRALSTGSASRPTPSAQSSS